MTTTNSIETDLACYDAAILHQLAQAEGYLNREDLERDGVVVGLHDLRTPLAMAVHVMLGRLDNDPEWAEPWAESLEQLAGDLVRRCEKLELELASSSGETPSEAENTSEKGHGSFGGRRRSDLVRWREP